MHRSLFRDIVSRALAEDLGSGDRTTDSIFTDEQGQARILVREPGIAAGLPIAEAVFLQVDPGLRFEALVGDGTEFAPGDCLATVSGRVSGILQGERVALNFLQRLCAIATATRRAVTAVSGTRARITDTRKTTPGLRVLEKYAVRVGGGENHRFNLSDMVLIKDNHIRGAGSIREAVDRIRARTGFALKIEIEAATLDDACAAIECGVDVIMLDNMSPAEMARTVGLVAGRALVEASGGISEQDLGRVAATGVDLISLGYLTHSVRALDIALKLV